MYLSSTHWIIFIYILKIYISQNIRQIYKKIKKEDWLKLPLLKSYKCWYCIYGYSFQTYPGVCILRPKNVHSYTGILAFLTINTCIIIQRYMHSYPEFCALFTEPYRVALVLKPRTDERHCRCRPGPDRIQGVGDQQQGQAAETRPRHGLHEVRTILI